MFMRFLKRQRAYNAINQNYTFSNLPICIAFMFFQRHRMVSSDANQCIFDEDWHKECNFIQLLFELNDYFSKSLCLLAIYHLGFHPTITSKPYPLYAFIMPFRWFINLSKTHLRMKEGIYLMYLRQYMFELTRVINPKIHIYRQAKEEAMNISCLNYDILSIMYQLALRLNQTIFFIDLARMNLLCWSILFAIYRNNLKLILLIWNNDQRTLIYHNVTIYNKNQRPTQHIMSQSQQYFLLDVMKSHKRYVHHKRQSQDNSLLDFYIYFLVMLDILELVIDPQTQRQFGQEQISKETIVNQIMSRLKERNLMNEAFIKRYIKKNTKRRVKKKFTLAVCEGLEECHTQELVNPQKHVIQSRKCPSHIEEKHEFTLGHYDAYAFKQKTKVSELKATNNTIEEMASSSLHNLTQTTTLDLKHLHQQAVKLQKVDTQNMHSPAKCDKSFTKYLRNFFINKLNKKDSQRQKQPQIRQDPRKSYNGRTQTEIQTDKKHKLKVKSLVFGNSQVVCARQMINSIQITKKDRVSTESYEQKHHARYNIGPEEQYKINRGILPTIHNSLAARNKKCLQNYIRFHHSKINKEKQLDFRSVKLPTQASLSYNTPECSRKGINNKLGALLMRKM